MTDSVYICSQHKPLGETWCGFGSRADIQAGGCVLCEMARLRKVLGETQGRFAEEIDQLRQWVQELERKLGEK